MLITSSTGNSRTVFPSRPTIVSAKKSESRMASSGREKAKFIGFQIPQGKLVYIQRGGHTAYAEVTSSVRTLTTGSDIINRIHCTVISCLSTSKKTYEFEMICPFLFHFLDKQKMKGNEKNPLCHKYKTRFNSDGVRKV